MKKNFYCDKRYREKSYKNEENNIIRIQSTKIYSRKKSSILAKVRGEFLLGRSGGVKREVGLWTATGRGGFCQMKIVSNLNVNGRK